MTENLPARMRMFIAVEVPLERREMLARIQRELDPSAKGKILRWTPPEQMHLTLKFLGQVDRASVPELEAALTVAIAGTAPFALRLETFGCFPSSHQPNVLWAGLGGEVDALRRLQKRIEDRARAFSEHEENREFHPHVTLGRVKQRGREARRMAETLLHLAIPIHDAWTVREVKLMRSEFDSGVPVHTTLTTLKLPGSADEK